MFFFMFDVFPKNICAREMTLEIVFAFKLDRFRQLNPLSITLSARSKLCGERRELNECLFLSASPCQAIPEASQ